MADSDEESCRNLVINEGEKREEDAVTRGFIGGLACGEG
jgi:hypothetical protein